MNQFAAMIPPEFRPFEFEEAAQSEEYTKVLKVRRDSNGRIVLQKELAYEQYPDENSKLMAFLHANGVVSKEETKRGQWKVLETDQRGVCIVQLHDDAITIEG